MEIQVDGSRSDIESWIEAREMSTDMLPLLSEEEISVAAKLAISADDYRRARYAADLSRKHLEYRAKNLGLLVERWLLTHSIDAQVKSVRLKTFAGKYSVNIKGSGSNVLVFDEELIDDMFEGGSEAAEAKFNRLLALNLLGEQEAQAS